MGACSSLDHAGLLAEGHEAGLEEASGPEPRLTGPRDLAGCGEAQVPAWPPVPQSLYWSSGDKAESPPQLLSQAGPAKLRAGSPPLGAHRM